MRRRSSACWTSSALLVLSAHAVGAPADLPSSTYPTQLLTEAEYLPDYCGASQPPPDARGVRLSLPAFMDTPNTEPPSSCTRERWLRLRFVLPAVPGRRYAVYLPELDPVGAVYLNGGYLGASQDFEAPDSYPWYYPLYLRLPDLLLRPGDNQLLVKCVLKYNGEGELGEVWVGESDALYQRYARQLWLQVTGIETVSLVVGLIGLLMFVLWVRRRREAVFGLFALSCSIWILRNTQFYVVHRYSPLYFGVLTDGALFWLVAVLFSLSFRILEVRVSWFELALYIYALAITLAMWLGVPDYKFVVTVIGYLSILPVCLGFVVHLARAVGRRPSVLLGLLCLAGIVTTLTGAYDVALMTNQFSWRRPYLMPYSALFYALTVGWALVDRFVASHSRYEALNIELEARVHERERQLAINFAKTVELESEQAVAAERERILRNMHDGLGLQLISAQRLIEKGEHPKQRLAEVLSDALDELRISIDSMKPSGHDLLVMLGNLRYRLEARLGAAGITLHWNVSGAVDASRVGPVQAAEVTRIVQEVCANAMKHSHASDMYLSFEQLGAQTVRISISDNGVGYDTSVAHRGDGLQNIRRRAARLSALLDMRSRPGETLVTLTVNLAADPANS